MSAELYSVSVPDGHDTSVQGTRVGGSKPLHRFMKGQPKNVGVAVLILGTSFFVIPISMAGQFPGQSIWSLMHSGFLPGLLTVFCGILYIVTEHYPTKKTVTMSLALSIVAALEAISSILLTLPDIGSIYYYRFSSFDVNSTDTENLWAVYHENLGTSLELILIFYTFVATIIFIVMSSMAGAALRSTKSQAIVVMTTAAPETPAE